jgi:hypothetical protein
MRVNRKDYFTGPLHLILRKSTQRSQYGILAWSTNETYILDIWFGQRLISFRRKNV